MLRYAQSLAPLPSRALMVARSFSGSASLQKNKQKSAAPAYENQRRIGVIATKIGMTSLYQEDGTLVPVTLLQVRANQAIQAKTLDIDGYSAVQVGAGERRPWRVTKPQKGHFDLHGVPYKQKIVEFRVPEDSIPEAGTEILATHFVPGQLVDVRGVTAGKGFAGAMKRWNFAGQPASHGQTLTHRALGSTGQCQDPGRVVKGKKMAGHMGARNRCQQNLEVFKIDETRNIIYVRGSVPGRKNGWNIITDSIKKPDQFKEAPPFPTDLSGAKVTYGALHGQQPKVATHRQLAY